MFEKVVYIVRSQCARVRQCWNVLTVARIAIGRLAKAGQLSRRMFSFMAGISSNKYVSMLFSEQARQIAQALYISVMREMSDSKLCAKLVQIVSRLTIYPLLILLKQK